MKTAMPSTTRAGPRTETALVGAVFGVDRPGIRRAGASVSSGVAPTMTTTCYRADVWPLRVGPSLVTLREPGRGRWPPEGGSRWGSQRKVAAGPVRRPRPRCSAGGRSSVPRWRARPASHWPRAVAGRPRRRRPPPRSRRRAPAVSGSRRTRKRPSARTSCREVDHIVVVMMENHSFDNILGALGRGDVLAAHRGRVCPTRPIPTVTGI